MGLQTPSLTARCLGEVLGTFILVFFGCGAVHVAILTGALAGLWQVAIVWGVSIMLAIYVVGGISGAHINPAITIALAVWGRFSWREVFSYVASQLAGAFAAAAVLFMLYGSFLAEKEKEKGVIRGEPGSEITAMCYGEYFPNPARLAAATEAYSEDNHAKLNALVSEPVALGAEVLGTLILALVVFAVTDERNSAAPAGRLAPVFIGLTVSALIAVIAPLTQACFNPARDFGPRLFASLAGWGTIALPGPRGGTGFLTVYILAPIIGAAIGGGLYTRLLRPYMPGLSSSTLEAEPQVTEARKTERALAAARKNNEEI
jgi:glycerol uptake facilitator protein